MNVLTATNITKRFGSYLALDNVSISLEKGKIYGFVGNNGAGKSTFMRILCGLSYPNSGTLKLFGNEDTNKLHALRSRIGALIESPIFYPDMTAQQNLTAQSILRQYSGKEQVEELLKLVGLYPVRRKLLKDFSTGMKQRYGLAAALLGEPELLVLDEPLNGLDVEGMDEISDLLTGICRERGTTILLSSHLLARLNGFATDYIFLDHGKVVETISASDLKKKVRGDLEDYFRKLVRHDILSKGGR